MTYCKSCKVCEHKNHNNGLITSVWGPAVWFSLQCMCKGYPCRINPKNIEHRRRQKKFYIFFSYILEDLLPCGICRKHYKDNYQQFPVDKYLDGRLSLCYWIWAFHNKVNLKIGKEMYSFDTFYKNFEKYRAKDNKKSKKKCILSVE